MTKSETILTRTRSRWRLILTLVLAVPLVLFVLAECIHRIRFGDFFGYGHHVDLVQENGDLGIPGIRTLYCLRIANYTLSPITFEAIQMPRGIFDGDVIYHERIERYDDKTASWLTIKDSVSLMSGPTWAEPNKVVLVSPGRSIYGSCNAVGALEAFRKGDTARLVAFTSYSKPEGAAGQLTFYSPAFTVRDEPINNTQKPDSHATTAGTAKAATR